MGITQYSQHSTGCQVSEHYGYQCQQRLPFYKVMMPLFPTEITHGYQTT